MSLKPLQFSLKGLLILVAVICTGCRLASRIVDLKQQADAHYEQSERFISLTNRFSREDQPNRRYCLDRARYHLVRGAEYHWAAFHPWLMVEPSAPPLPPPDVLRLLARA